MAITCADDSDQLFMYIFHGIFILLTLLVVTGHPFGDQELYQNDACSVVLVRIMASTTE